MKPCELRKGEIVQINPESHEMFGGCLMVVTEPKPWGVKGYVQGPGASGVAYFRCRFEDVEPTGGVAPWVVE